MSLILCKGEFVRSDEMRIAMLGHKQIPSRTGGIEIVVEELSKRMVENGHKVTCYNRSDQQNYRFRGKGKKGREYQGVRIKYLPTIKRKGLAAVSSSFFGAWRVGLGKYDIVHFHAEGPCAFLWIPKFLGKRCIATIHGLDWKRAKWKNSFGRKFIRYGEKVAVKYADEIIVLSEDMQQYFQKEYNRKTFLIPNGVNEPRLRAAEEIQDKWGLTTDSYILFLGRLVPEKGIKYLLEAYQHLHTEKKLVIAGGASDTEDFCQELHDCSKENRNIIFTGHVEGNVLDELYSNAYLYCLPSDLEGMPLSLLEAMSYGNCCVVSDIPECLDVVEDRAVVFKKGDVESLRYQLQRLCEHTDEANYYKTHAASFILKKHNWERITESTLAIYRNELPDGEQ